MPDAQRRNSSPVSGTFFALLSGAVLSVSPNVTGGSAGSRIVSFSPLRTVFCRRGSSSVRTTLGPRCAERISVRSTGGSTRTGASGTDQSTGSSKKTASASHSAQRNRAP